MVTTNEVGLIGEARIEYEAIKRGYMVALPRGHGIRYDLIVDRKGKLEKVQVKTVHSDGKSITVKTQSTSKHVNGKKKAVNYKKTDFDWIAVHDITTDACFFIPSKEMTSGGAFILRMTPPKNNQKKGIRWAKEFSTW